MGRWAPGGRGRLEVAALELYATRGYEQTTVADIAERAGLTERTYFRHFADKREVLFSGSPRLQQLVVDAVLAQPVPTPPLDAVVAGLDAAAEVFDGQRDWSVRRSAVIGANPVLAEREQQKLATLAGALATALEERGVVAAGARLAADLGVVVFATGFARWVGDGEDRPLAVVQREVLAELRAVAAG